MNINDEGPAFPVPDVFAHSGMTLRDWFAGQADVSEIIKALTLKECETIVGEPLAGDLVAVVKWNLKIRAILKYMYADAMIAARNPNGEQK